MSSQPRWAAPGRALALVSLVSLLALAGCVSEGGDEAPPRDAAAENAVPEASDAAVPQSDAPVPQVPALQQEQMALMAELRSIDETLQPIRERALQDPEVQAQRNRLVEHVQEAMSEIDPETTGNMARFDSLRVEFGAAQRAGEQERLQGLATELRSLQASLQRTQGAALEQEDVAEALDAFREDLHDQMRQIDPQADSLLDRADELRDRLDAMQAPGR